MLIYGLKSVAAKAAIAATVPTPLYRTNNHVIIALCVG